MSTSTDSAAALAILIIAAAALGAWPGAAAAEVPERWPDEISGMAQLPQGRLLLVDDEERRQVFILPAASPGGGFPGGPLPHALPLVLDDLEGATVDSSGAIYLLTSHSLTRKGKFKPRRRLLVRLAPAWVGAGGGRDGSAGGAAGGGGEPPPVAAVRDLLDRLPCEPWSGRTPNFEGIAWYPAAATGDRLLLGVRAPLTAARAAIIVEVGPAAALFAGQPVRCTVHTLDLGGRGIRGLEYDPWRRGCLVLAGRSARRPGTGGGGPDAAVYLWRPGATGAGETLVELRVDGLEALPQPEAIAPGGPPGTGGRGPLLLATEGRPLRGLPVVRLTAHPLRAAHPIEER